MKTPIVIMEVLLGSALIIGASEAKVFTMPTELFDQQAMSQNFEQGFESMPLFSPDNIHVLWFHNVRAFVMATILGIFSFGVLGLLVLMLPMLIVGYFLGAAAAAGFSPWQFAVGFVLTPRDSGNPCYLTGWSGNPASWWDVDRPFQREIHRRGNGIFAGRLGTGHARFSDTIAPWIGSAGSVIKPPHGDDDPEDVKSISEESVIWQNL